MGDVRKITVEVPEDLLAAAQAFTGEGITETVREALELLRQREVQNRARQLRGKVRFSVDLMKLREDED
jgi:hypothetical protein